MSEYVQSGNIGMFSFQGVSCFFLWKFFETLMNDAQSDLLCIWYRPWFEQEATSWGPFQLINTGKCKMQQNLWLEGLLLYKAGKLWKTVSKAYGVCKHVQKFLTSPETTLCYQEQRVAGWRLRLQLSLDRGCRGSKLYYRSIEGGQKFLDVFH